MSFSLYQLTDDYKKLADLEDEQLIDTLDSIEGAIEIKVENIAKFIKNLEAEAEAADNEAKRLQAIKTSRSNKAKSLKEYALGNLLKAGIKKVPTSIGSISVANNPGALVVENEQLIPAEYWEVVPETKKLDSAKIKAAIKEGLEVPGANIQKGYRLAIR